MVAKKIHFKTENNTFRAYSSDSYYIVSIFVTVKKYFRNKSQGTYVIFENPLILLCIFAYSHPGIFIWHNAKNLISTTIHNNVIMH